MKTRCNNCRALVSFKTRYCEKCEAKIRAEHKRQASERNKKVEATTKSGMWKSLRRKILLRDKCCILCLKSNYIEQRGLEVHHIIKRIENEELIYEPSNLVTVCKSCHEVLEKLPATQQKALLGNFERIDTHRLL